MSARDALVIAPAERFCGTISVPGDKSVGHRALMLAALCRGVTEIENLSDGADNHSTRAVLRQLGVTIEEPAHLITRVVGRADEGLMTPDQPLDCGNSGTTMRLLSGLLAGQGVVATLTGDESLSRRPMGRIVTPLAQMGVNVMAGGAGQRPPLRLTATSTPMAVTYESPVASAQVKSAVLLASLKALGDTVVVEPSPSRDHTERLLRYLGYRVESSPNYQQPDGKSAYARIYAPGQRLPIARPITVPGDISSAAFFLAAASLVAGADLTLTSVSTNPTRTGILDILTSMGVPIEWTNRKVLVGNEPVADLHLHNHGEPLKPLRIAADLVPRAIDELPVLAVLATAAHGETVVSDARELRVKESDRIATTVALLQAAGADVLEEEDGFRVRGPTPLRAFSFNAMGDHRLAMAAAVAALVADRPCEIHGAEACAVSYPGFFQDLQRLTRLEQPTRGLGVEREPS